ncbi:MAG TPA: hypothetical protein VFQ01_04025 [Nocardioides sp.]|jgi:hypothetical protein|nr:hypothetical protein [Nocardioides sp.]
MPRRPALTACTADAGTLLACAALAVAPATAQPGSRLPVGAGPCPPDAVALG